jgi:hypothetical protein
MNTSPSSSSQPNGRPKLSHRSHTCSHRAPLLLPLLEQALGSHLQSLLTRRPLE